MNIKSGAYKSPKNIAFWGSIIILILVSYLWRLRVIDKFPLNYDEGIHLILSRLWAAGHVPYEEIFVSYPPSFLWSLGVPWKLFNQVNALRLVMTSYALVGVMAVVYLGVAYHSRLAGIAAGTLLSFAPAYFVSSFSIMTEIPSIGMATAAIALAEKYRRDGFWLFALLTGVGLGFGLSLKMLPYYAVPLVTVMVMSRHFGPNLKILFRDLAVMVAGFLAILLAPVFLFNVTALFDQVVAMRLVSRAVELNPLESNNDFMVDFLFGNPGLLVLASYGFVFVVARNFRHFWPLVLWLGLIWISIYFLVPLRAKHLPIFLPVVALFAGFAIDHIFRFIIKLRNQQVSPRLIAMVLTIFVVLGMFIWNLPYAIAENNGQSLGVDVNKERLNAIAFIDTIATYDDCVIADNPVFLYQTRRLPPPELSETSQTRIDSGYLSLPDVIRSIQTHKCHVVAVVTPRFGESMPGLQEWLAENYLGLHAQSETTVYFALKGDPTQRENEKDFNPVENGSFEEIVRVNGVRLSGQPWPEENSAYISLLWQLQSPITGGYVEQIILRDTQSQEQVFRMNRVPFEGRFDPATWQVGQQVWDTFRLTFPMDLPPGSYDLNLSLCPLENGPCLSIDEPTKTELYLGRITL